MGGNRELPSPQVRGEGRASQWAQGWPRLPAFVERSTFNTSGLQREIKLPGPLETPVHIHATAYSSSGRQVVKLRVSTETLPEQAGVATMSTQDSEVEATVDVLCSHGESCVLQAAYQ